MAVLLVTVSLQLTTNRLHILNDLYVKKLQTITSKRFFCRYILLCNFFNKSHHAYTNEGFQLPEPGSTHE